MNQDIPSKFSNQLRLGSSSDYDFDGDHSSTHLSSSDEDTRSPSKKSKKSKKDTSKHEEELRRRETIFGQPSSSKTQAKSSSNLLILKSITRENFPNVELRSLDLEHICSFLDNYERIIERHPDQGLRMIDFVSSKLHSVLTIAASDLRYVSASTFGLGVYTLSDRRLKKCILHLVRAVSPEDYIKKIRSVRFPGGDDGFEPSALNFNILFDRATLFGHRFDRILQMITKRARDRDIPPLYKNGKTSGIIDYFLAAWPQNTGNSLYAKLSINHSSLRNMPDFSSFLHKFFKALKPYKKLREGLMGLDSILNIKHEDTYAKVGKVNNVSHEPEYDDIYEDTSNDVGDFINPSDTEYENELAPESHMDVDTAPEGVLEQKDEQVKPCKKMFEFGECTDRKCTGLHDRDAMTRFQDKILKNLVKSQFVDSEDAFLEKVRKLFSLKRNTEMYES